jgi:peroxiredoxin
LLVVFPISAELTSIVVDSLELPYPLYADEDYTLFRQYETRFSAGPPLPAWIVVDVNGVIRYLWRATEGGLFDHYPEGDEIVEEIRRLGP